MLTAFEAVFQNPIIAFILLVGVVVFVHEAGHFIAGRLLGVDVEEFSLGFGPKAFGFKRGMTEYKICWLPLGGYVRFYGAEIGREIPLEKRERAITTARLHKRALISFAGPLANFLLSIAIMIVLSNVGLPQPAPVISVIPGSVAEKAGFETGDRIARISDQDVTTWADLNRMISQSPGRALDVVVERGPQVTRTISVTPAVDETQGAFGEQVKVGRIGISQFLLTPRLVVPDGSYLAAAGLRTGDLVTAIDGSPVRYLHELERALTKAFGGVSARAFATAIENAPSRAESQGAGVTLTVARPGETATGNIDALAVHIKELDKRKAQALSRANGEGAGTSTRDVEPETADSSATSTQAPSEREVLLGATNPALMQWARDEMERTGASANATEASAIPARASLPALLGTDLTFKSFEDLKRGDKRQAAVDAWKACGLKGGDTLAALEGVGPLRTPTQLSMWLQEQQTTLSNTLKSSGGSVPPLPVLLTVVGLDGVARPLMCEIPVRIGKDSLNRDQAGIDFPAHFLTRGVSVEPVVVKSANAVASLGDGVKAAGEQASTIFTGIKKLVSGSVPFANLGGPIAIARVAGDAAEGGLIFFVLTISWMSINIGMFNLLPLPALDGGTLLLHGVEAAYGKPLPLRVQTAVQRVGVAIILGLIVLVFYNDILRLFHS